MLVGQELNKPSKRGAVAQKSQPLDKKLLMWTARGTHSHIPTVGLGPGAASPGGGMSCSCALGRMSLGASAMAMTW